MQCKKRSSELLSSRKPVNIFYVWYTELCRRLNSSPASVVRPAKPKCHTVLEFFADRLKAEEWSPVINALRQDTSLHVIAIRSRLGNCQFLHDVDSEDKVRSMKRRYGSLWTAFILKSLLKSLSCTVRNNEVLTVLELDGLPVFALYLEPLLKALQKNRTLKTFSLTRCHINDIGCEMVCTYIRFTPNVEVLNLSGCGLTAESGEYLAKLIKYQQINRYCETWHNSLRYSDPSLHTMKGIKRITLNGNPFFGDDGLQLILNELDDDLWIKALDMQKCGITDNISMKIIDVVEYSSSLEIVDFRLNDELSISTIEKILDILKQRQVQQQPEYQWCNTTFTLTCDGTNCDTLSNYSSVSKQLHKTRSVPVQSKYSKLSIRGTSVRRTQTVENVPKKQMENVTNYLGDVEQKVMELNCQLQEEIAKRKETEKLNEELRRKLHEIKSFNSFQGQPGGHLKTLMSAIENFTPKPNGIVNHSKTGKLESHSKVNNSSHLNGFSKRDANPTKFFTSKEKAQPTGVNNTREDRNKRGDLCYLKNGFRKEEASSGRFSTGTSKSVMNGFHEKNGYHPINDRVDTVSSLLEKLLGEDSEEGRNGEVSDAVSNYTHRNGEESYNDNMSSSQVSLYNFMESLKEDVVPRRFNGHSNAFKHQTSDKLVKCSRDNRN